MRKDHTPLLIKKIKWKFNHWIVEHKIRPQFDSLGTQPAIHKPLTLNLTGSGIHAGNFLHIISNKAQPVNITAWRSKQHRGGITIGNYVLISPGVNIASAQAINIGSNTMLAAEVVISDCDWHGLYNRIRPFRCTAAVTLQDNVWVGQRSIICKGVTIGENSVIGAGSVVTHDIPANVVAAGNPARVVKKLNPARRMLKREYLFQGGQDYWRRQQEIELAFNQNNGFMQWLKMIFAPSKKD